MKAETKNDTVFARGFSEISFGKQRKEVIQINYIACISEFARNTS